MRWPRLVGLSVSFLMPRVEAWGASVPAGNYQALRIRILRPLRVRFIVSELSSTEMRSYSKTDLQQTLFYASFMCVIKKSLHRSIARIQLRAEVNLFIQFRQFGG